MPEDGDGADARGTDRPMPGDNEGEGHHELDSMPGSASQPGQCDDQERKSRSRTGRLRRDPCSLSGASCASGGAAAELAPPEWSHRRIPDGRTPSVDLGRKEEREKMAGKMERSSGEERRKKNEE